MIAPFFRNRTRSADKGRCLLLVLIVLTFPFCVRADDDPKLWAFRKPVRHPIPTVKEQQRVRTPVDAFILQKLEEKGLSFASDADRTRLVRRVYFDLIGLPPTPEQLQTALADRSETWFEKVVDRLLASPHYGERWGRHWLDSAGYADTIKSDNEVNGATIRDGLWRYRDYVVRSFNADKPYDRFLLEQLAGDEMVSLCGTTEFPSSMQELLIATGFWRTAIDGTNNFERNRPMERYQLLHDTIESVTSNLLGLTVHCVRCHDHKYDPITQQDYYRFMACLTPAYNPEQWLMPHERFINVSTEAEKEEIRKHNQQLDQRAGQLGNQVAQVRRGYEPRLIQAKYDALPEALRAPLRQALAVQKEKRSDIQKLLAGLLGPLVRVTNEEVTANLSAEDRRIAEALEDQIADLRASRRSENKIQALFDVGSVPVTRVLKRGSHETPGEAVEPGLPVVLAGSKSFGDDEANTYGSSGRRLALAQSLTEPNSVAAGLLARVLVNRIWHHHFGRGIVATPGNLGRTGAAPTHPELLDWLATELIQTGWKLKTIHRLLLTSTVYRQSSRIADCGSRIADSNSSNPQSAIRNPQLRDPANLLLWKMRLRRLESESIRDAILSVSGKLDDSMGGPPLLLEGRPDGTVVVSRKGLPTPSSVNRRSLYLLARRNFNLSFLSVFDQPLMAINCTCRNSSSVVSQSLTMLNDTFVLEQAHAFAQRVTQSAGDAPEARIRSAFQIALARDPNDAEIVLCAELLRRQAQRYQTEKPAVAADHALLHLCHMLLNTNEFLYLE